MPKYVDVSTLGDISIVAFLARLGHHAVKKSGKEHFYHSMLRETGRNTPSFTVWDAGRKWLDRGGANRTGISGGGIIQLGMAYWPDLSFVEVLNKILEVNEFAIDEVPVYEPEKYLPDQKVTTYQFELVKTEAPGCNPLLTRYLESRGILEQAAAYVKEIYYRHRDRPEDPRIFFAVGWENENDGWEFSNLKGFKSSIGPKGISIIPGNPEHAILFEGFMDFLSWLKENRPPVMPTVIVLNSISLLSRAISLLVGIPKVEVFFDRDEPGRKCSGELRKVMPWATDCSFYYIGYKDYNEKIKHAPKILSSAGNPAHPTSCDQLSGVTDRKGRKR